MKRLGLLPLALLICLAVPDTCFGWGDPGHMIVGQIAWNRLKPDAKRAIKALLKDESLAEVTMWADEIKGRLGYPKTRHLHYANPEPGVTEFVLERDCPEKGCVVSAILKYADVLRDQEATTTEKTDALKFVAHFVGDIHQPLHVGYAKDADGNGISVSFFDDSMNLHQLWDYGLINHRRKPWSDYAKQLNQTIKLKQWEQWQSTDPTQWATESRKLAVSNAYEVPSDGELAKDYFDRNIPVVEERLKMGGVRLATLLNEIFSSHQPVD